MRKKEYEVVSFFRARNGFANRKIHFGYKKKLNCPNIIRRFMILIIASCTSPLTTNAKTTRITGLFDEF
jgi:hypothetical protein